VISCPSYLPAIDQGNHQGKPDIARGKMKSQQPLLRPCCQYLHRVYGVLVEANNEDKGSSAHRFMLGDVADKVSHHAPCAVLLIK